MRIKFRLQLLPGTSRVNKHGEWLRAKFGGKVVTISGYVTAIRNGESIYYLPDGLYHDGSSGGHAFFFAGDLKAFKRHHPTEYAIAKASGKIGKKVGRKWVCRT